MPNDPPFLTPMYQDALRDHGVPAPWRFGMADRVRFHELDALNHVNNATYLTWFETLRVAYLRTYEVYEYVPGDPLLVMRAVTVDYHAPLFLGETYITTGRTTRLGRTSFQMAYGVFVEGTLRVEGTAAIVLLAPDGRTGVPLSDDKRDILIRCDGAIPR